jgi:hypothetical protein
MSEMTYIQHEANVKAMKLRALASIISACNQTVNNDNIGESDKEKASTLHFDAIKAAQRIIDNL